MTPTLLHNPDTHKLGKLDAKPPHAMLRDLVDFEKAAATVQVPANIVNSSTSEGGPAEAIALAMYLNDQEGDCTCAGIGNKLRLDSNGSVEISDDTVQSLYVQVTGEEGAAFDPQTGANDNGCAELDVLDHVTKNPLEGIEEIVGHAGVDYTNDSERRMALYLCGALYSGEQLSTDQQTQQIWEPGKAAAGSWGGHCTVHSDEYTEIPSGLVIGGVPIPAGIPGGFVFAIGTWGAYKPCAGTYIPFAYDELHAVLTKPLIAKLTALGIIDEAGAQAFLKTLAPEA